MASPAVFDTTGRLLPHDEGRGTPYEAAQAGLDTLEVLPGTAGTLSACRGPIYRLFLRIFVRTEFFPGLQV